MKNLITYIVAGRVINHFPTLPLVSKNMDSTKHVVKYTNEYVHTYMHECKHLLQHACNIATVDFF